MRDRPGPSGPGLLGPALVERAPRPGGGIRSIVRLRPEDERGYAAPLRPIVPLLGARSRGSYANRVMGWSDGLPVLEAWPAARDRWRMAARRAARGAPVVVTADVRDCYPSIRGFVVRRWLEAMRAPSETVDDVDAWLQAFADRGFRGLPVGPAASAVLAEGVLAAGDHALRSKGTMHVRWVDDVAIFAASRREAMAALDTLIAAWRSIGLAPNEAKIALHTDAVAWFTLTDRTASLVGVRTLR